MTHRNEVLDIACEGESLIGILSTPALSGKTGVIIVVGGPQYRIGSHRQFVLLARHLADAGYPVLRFDHRGIGDSSGDARDFESIESDIHAAINAMYARLPSLQGVVLWGLCDAASAALLHQHHRQDARVRGLALVNPWVRSHETLARAHIKHYYADRLRQSSFWRKLFRREISGRAWVGLFSNLRTMLSGSSTRRPEGFQRQMAQAWQQFSGPLLLILSERDYTAKEFIEAIASQVAWREALQKTGLTRVDVTQADHTFSSQADREHVERATLTWLESLSTHGSPAAKQIG